MQTGNVRIKGIGHYVPDRVLTNYELEHMVETTNEWIVERSGISERRILDKEGMNVGMAVRASLEAIGDAGIDVKDIDLIIMATITPDYLTPSGSCMVQEALGADNAAAFDLNAACSGFIYAMSVAAQFISSGAYGNVLVIGSEALSKITDWGHRSTCVLFGDGAGAVVMTSSERKSILGFDLGASGNLGRAITVPGTYFSADDLAERDNKRLQVIRMDGREVFKFATRAVAQSVDMLLVESGLAMDDIALIIPHQANIRIMQTAAKRLGVDMDRIYSVIHKYGNTSSASIPIALSCAVGEGRIHGGDKIIMTGFGGGLTWASVLIEWP